MQCVRAKHAYHRIVEEEIESAIESRNEALQSLRELGPPDLVHLVKQSVKSGGRQVGLERRYKDTTNDTHKSFLDRRLPSCYWCRCIILSQFGCVR